MAFSCYAAERGHEVHLFDKAAEIGGQFNYAKQIPGKEEFYETLRYFTRRIEITGVKLHLNSPQTAESLQQGGFDQVILATGIKPRPLELPGVDHPKVLSYLDVLRDHKPVGKKVAIIGAGGIGFDVAEYLAEPESLTREPDHWMKYWGIDKSYQQRGGLTEREIDKTEREIWLLQRKTSKVGKYLGATSGWVHRKTLQSHNVQMVPGVTYKKIDDKGLLIEVNEKEKLLEVDNIIICAGQLPLRELQQELEQAGITTHLIGGADVAAELDAKRAIRQGAELAARI